MKNILIFIVAFLIYHDAISQLKYSEDSIHGGVAFSEYSPRFDSSGTGYFHVNVPDGATIAKALLIVGRQGQATDIDVQFNGYNVPLNNGSEITSFNSPSYGGASGVHIIDVSVYISPGDYTYTLVVPTQSQVSDRYQDYGLLVMYTKNDLPLMHVALFLNTFDFSDNVTYDTYLTSPITACCTSAMSIMTGYICNASTDGEKIKLNNYYLGLIGGNAPGTETCSCQTGDFTYSNNTLAGAAYNNIDIGTVGTDALSDPAARFSGNYFTVKFYSVTNGNTTNAVWAVVFAWGDESPLAIQYQEQVQKFKHKVVISGTITGLENYNTIGQQLRDAYKAIH